jgi:hypothetical protein
MLARQQPGSNAIPGIAMSGRPTVRYAEDVALIFDIFNDAWRDNWGFVQRPRSRRSRARRARS